MSKKKRTKYLIILLSLLTSIGIAQDFHLSQFEASPMHMNPAMTGMFKGSYRLSMHQRNQWMSVISNPFLTSALSFDTKFKKFNAGAYLINYRAGTGGFNSMNLILSGAYDYSFKENPYHHIAFGVQGGLIHKNVNMNNLSFEDQYEASNGGSFSLPSSENFSNSSTIMPEANAGLMYYYSNSAKKFNPFVGFSAFHLTEPKESFFSSDNKLPRRYLAHAGAKININERFQFLVHSTGMRQKNVDELMFSWIGYYYMKEQDIYLLYGTTRRTNDDAMIAQLGLKYGKFTYRLSYDVNTSSLSTISNGRGGFEISIVYISNKVDPNPVRSCPDL